LLLLWDGVGWGWVVRSIDGSGRQIDGFGVELRESGPDRGERMDFPPCVAVRHVSHVGTAKDGRPWSGRLWAGRTNTTHGDTT
jgi:hypothetical protein